MTKKLNLIWETYNDHLQSMLNDLRSSNELTDVTLVSEDREQFRLTELFCMPAVQYSKV